MTIKIACENRARPAMVAVTKLFAMEFQRLLEETKFLELHPEADVEFTSGEGWSFLRQDNKLLIILEG